MRTKNALFLLVAMLTTLLAVPAQAAQAPVARLDPDLVTQLDDAAADDRVAVYVHADDAELARSAVERSGLRLVEVFEKVAVAVAVGTPDQIRAAGREHGITYLEADEPLRFHLGTSHQATRDDLVAEGAVGPAVDGSGVTIAVIDEGIDGTHPMFQMDGKSKVVRNFKFACSDVLNPCVGPQGDANETPFIEVTDTTNDSDTVSAGGHGTHVAGIAAGAPVTTADGRELRGTAPGAHLVGLSVGAGLSVYGGTSGMNWVLEHHADPCEGALPAGQCPPIKVINNSWGSTGEYEPASARSKIQDQLVAEGVTVVWSAGNDGGDGSTNQMGPETQSPTPGILGVANYSDANQGTRDNDLHETSSRGVRGRTDTYPDISAPGTSITSACRPYLAICSSGDADPNYGTISGTSMASPHIAGVVALLLDANDALTPAQIENVLEDTAYQFHNGLAYEPDNAGRNDDHTTSFDKGHGLVDAAAALAEVRSLAIGGGPSCTDPEGPVVVDDEGDATRFLEDTPLPSEPALDVRQGTLDWDATTETLTFTISVTDLTDENPIGSNGMWFDFYFNYWGTRYYMAAERSTDGERFLLGRLGTTRETLAITTGSFDAEQDEVRIVLTDDVVDEANQNENFDDVDVAPLADGSILAGFHIDSRRQIEAGGRGVLPDADAASGRCPYTLGVGAVPQAPPPPPPPTPQGIVSVDSPFAWDGPVTTDSYFVFGCTGLFGLQLSSHACDVTRILVEMPDPDDGIERVLAIGITADNPEVNDYDFTVYGPDGTEVGGSGSEGTLDEYDEIPISETGLYTVEVRAWATAEATYHGLAELKEGTAPPPPPPGDFDGEISLGQTYEWTGTTPVPSQIIFFCNTPFSVLCDNEYVMVNVPSGGAKIAITITADDPADDFDVDVYDPGDARIGSGQAVGDESVQFAVSTPGVYRIAVRPFLALGGYSGSISLVPSS